METILMQSERRLRTSGMLQKLLLFSGIISVVWYIAINLIIPLRYAGYSVVSQTVSELSAIDAPTRTLWLILSIPFSILTILFGWGVWTAAGHDRKLHLAGVIIILDAIIGSFWPPMHKREVIAAGGGTLTDNLHLVWAFIHLVCMLLMMGFGAAALGKKFRIYSLTTVAVFIIFGILTSVESGGIKAGAPTPYIGIWERINIGAYMIWVVVFATTLLRKTGREMRVR